MRKGVFAIAAAAAAAFLVSPTLAQTPQQGQTIVGKRAPDAAVSASSSSWDKVAGSWKSFKGKIRKQWGKLTNDDLAVAQGRREELVGKIQARYGIDKDKADQQVDAWLKQQK